MTRVLIVAGSICAEVDAANCRRQHLWSVVLQTSTQIVAGDKIWGGGGDNRWRITPSLSI